MECSSHGKALEAYHFCIFLELTEARAHGKLILYTKQNQHTLKQIDYRT